MLPFAFVSPPPMDSWILFSFARLRCNLLAKWELPSGKGSEQGDELSPHSELSCV
jgi:hypothetical protein